MLALDVATNCGLCYDIKKTLHIGTVVGHPTFQYGWLRKNTKYKEVVIEELVSYNSPNPKVLVNLAQRVGYLYNRFIEDKMPTRWAHPGSWRKNLSLIQSKAGTRELQITLRDMFQTVFTLDEVDSVGVWLYGSDMKVADIKSYTIVKVGKNVEGRKTS